MQAEPPAHGLLFRDTTPVDEQLGKLTEARDPDPLLRPPSQVLILLPLTKWNQNPSWSEIRNDSDRFSTGPDPARQPLLLLECVPVKDLSVSSGLGRQDGDLVHLKLLPPPLLEPKGAEVRVVPDLGDVDAFPFF
jgi:hypothetical protein